MKSDWEDLKTVLCLQRGGSLAAAAKILGVNYTTVARRVDRLELSLDVKLFDRLASGYVVTDAGLEVARYASEMESRQDSLYRALRAQRETLRGPLKITAPQLLISSHLMPVLDEFTKLYPDVDLAVLASNELLNLNRREADIAIRVSDKPADTLVGQRLTKQKSAVYASPAVAEIIKDNPRRMIDWIGFNDWSKPPPDALSNYPNNRMKIRFDDMSVAIAAAEAGLGVIGMPMFLGNTNRHLVQVPVRKPRKYPDIWVLSHRDLRADPGVSAFKKLLLPYFKSKQSDFWID